MGVLSRGRGLLSGGWVVVCLLLAAGARAGLSAQSGSPSLAGAFRATSIKGDLLATLASLEWRPGLCFAGAKFTVGQTRTLRINLEAGRDYAFLAAGGLPGYDFDLHLRYPDGAVVARDTLRDDTPVIELAAPKTAGYLLQLTLVSGPTERVSAAVGLLTKRGVELPLATFAGSGSAFFAALNDHRAGSGQTPRPAPEEQWSFYGFAFGDDQGATLEGITPRGAPQQLIAQPFPRVRKLEAYLATPAGAIVAAEWNARQRIDLQTPATDEPLRLHLRLPRNRSAVLITVGLTNP